MNNIVTMKWLLARLYESDLVIVDCRFALGKPESGQASYEESHIPRAVYLDLEKDLSSPITEHGGRHPLPDLDTLAKRLGQSGIHQGSRVVIYDDQGGAMASRLWWLLKYTGHEQAYVMAEGYSAWKSASYPVTDEQPIVIPVTYEMKLQPHKLVSVHDVREASQQGISMLLDSREPRRYAGLEEPLDAKAGHIPGAKNYFWKGVLEPSGHWKAPGALREHFSDIPQDAEIIVYCGSGVTACPNVLALEETGYGHVKLYAGSWSDWISYEDNPVATGDE
ncbi:Rhodanese domain protein [Paenibacillus vortex V453]|jgi:thiosulfate/3-mercaptopyruvate sulfurtransferase|uniref:Rhodanese domain protein n=1 Tax=Paenibacillus vortex V453 TaxID=715225 RepID=A0A2R9SNF6_9BACL|nr:sulfurtransferase [Paenibacillus vortex]EFU38917.1 Rhodanese domain protein [Paenibacillus vortex V453]